MYASIPRTVLLTAVLLALAACAPQDVALPTFPPEARASGVNRDYVGAATASIEERIWLSDVVVRANLQSSAAGLLTFRAVEYLKGTGFSMFTVSAETDGRPTTWDGQEAVLFLGASATRPTTGFVFTDTTTRRFGPGRPEDPYAGTLPTGYTVDSRNPVWVPLSSGSGSARAYAVGGGESLDLDDLRATIAWLGGSGPGYDRCIRAALWLTYGPTAIGRSITGSELRARATMPRSPPGTPRPSCSNTGIPSGHVYVHGLPHQMGRRARTATFSALVTVDDDTDPTNGFQRSPQGHAAIAGRLLRVPLPFAAPS